jgi:hypothetical protein
MSTLQVFNTQFHVDIPFADYLALPGWSFSGIKGAKIEPTPKMQLGTKVHAYLLTSQEYEHDSDLVRPLAVALKGVLSPLLKYCTPELAVTADFVHEGMVLHYKGRIDLPIIHKSHLSMVIDIKCTEMDIRKSIDFFHYDHQVNGYMLAIGALKGVIFSVNPKTKKTQVQSIRKDTAFWERAVLRYGKPIQ